MEQSYRHHYLNFTKIPPVRCLYETVRLPVSLTNPPPERLFHSAQSFSFELKRNATQIQFDFDILKLLLNLQESLYTSTHLRHFTKA